MNFEQIDQEWSRMSFALDALHPQEIKVDMFVRLSDPEKKLYEIGWAKEFAGENSCNFKPLEQVMQETGLDFGILGIQDDLSTTFFLKNQTEKDVVYIHSISRLWAAKNGLAHNAKDHEETIEQVKDESNKTQKLEKKVKKLEKMTLKLLKQNSRIYKTIKVQGEESLIDKLFK